MDSEVKLSVLFTAEQIAAAVKRLASEIRRDYLDKNPVLIAVLKGSFVFLADLARQLNFPLQIEFAQLSSYGHGRESAGKIKVVKDVECDIRGRHVLVVEDIIDTGITAQFFLKHLMKKQPVSLKLCSLTDKPSRTQVKINIDYLGLTVPDKFIVGYGIDWDEKFRYLPDIRAIEDGG
ncbi:MAG TPA: hypoxanthine phosphoribosyltransferase [Dehalococcoidales bacterium]|nr:hypoxanthine phosphoribosyltransferase [Dehalococcoidales bacterium]